MQKYNPKNVPIGPEQSSDRIPYHISYPNHYL